METNIEVKEMPAMDLVYCRHVGHLIRSEGLMKSCSNGLVPGDT